uniref:Uncharacterized protein n=1 Tax=Arundo donax TaxID=35708 RepID=A0A0A9EIZ2_ARUDO
MQRMQELKATSN